ncbi:cytochrome P450 [Roridomyces roridus]|uniref:Cytochrome P450 n=1 Tax=Roridomyces roridus TaxID=1738132 RepID=A0AAD7FRX1_9AGAR|nr:cytochrome P450 [Roridomyces roridus]
MVEISLQQAALAGLALAGGVTVYSHIKSRARSGGRPLPPGPPRAPLVGNLLQFPSEYLGTYFRKLCEEYGGLVSLSLPGTDILDKRGAKFSARPVIPYVFTDVDPDGAYWAWRDQNAKHHVARKLTAGLMSGIRAGETEAVQQFEALISMTHLLEDGGKNWSRHLDRAGASMIFTVAFGSHCPTGEERDFKDLLKSLEMLVNLLNPAASITNILPFLDWLPGPMPWRKRAEAYRKYEDDMYNRLFENALTGKGAGMNTWTAAFAEDKPEGDQRQLMKNFTLAAVETSTSTMQIFVLAYLLYPDWIARARKEIDSVVGPNRLPTFKDRPRLPFVDALVRETLRWRPAARFGLPHYSTEDDIVEHKGKEYFIPKGSIVFGVTWAIEHDKNKYENPDEFRPERFLDADGQLKAGYETSAFGFGRRICPGVPFAERTLWISIAMIMWSFDIHKTVDPTTGLPFEYDGSDGGFSKEVSSAPLKFPAVFVPRSEHHAEVIRQEWDGCEKDLNVLLPQRKDR